MATPSTKPQDLKAEPVQPSKLGAALLTASESAVAMMCFLVCMSIIERDVRTLMIVGATGLISGACSRAIIELVAKIQSADRSGAKRAEERTARENSQAAGTSGLSSAMGSLVPLLGAAFIKDHQLRLVVVMVVCKYAASSKEEWVEQCKLWPTSYHPPTYYVSSKYSHQSCNISGITGFSEEDSQSVVSFMKYALELAKSHGNVVVNAAAIVDPLSNQVIARACDEVCSWQTPKTEVGAECGGPEQVVKSISCLHPRWWVDEQSGRSSSFCHPLRHAAIVAIESSAARDRHFIP